MSRAIEEYGRIGDGETAALHARDGSVDWLCWPRFDDNACLAALLGDAEHGRWRLAPESGAARTATTRWCWTASSRPYEAWHG